MRHVIIGNSFAGIFAAEAIRKRSEGDEITIISQEPQRPYSRAMIHELLAGLVDERLVYMRDADFFETLRIEPLLGRQVTGIDPSSKTVKTDDGGVEYDRLLISTGGAPFIPPIEGLDSVASHTFTTMDDATGLQKAAADAKSAVVVGAGLIGLQCGEALATLGVKVTVVEMADAILPMALDEDSSGIVAKELKAEGIEIRTSNTAQEVEGKDGQPTACLLQDGSRVECDVLVVAVGVRPNVDFVRDSGIEIDQGIVVNLKMETSIEDIYAAGDCAQGPEIITGKTMAIPVIPVASTHGYVAGCNMVGEDSTYVGGLSLNAIQFGGIQAISYGFVKDETDAEVMRVRDDNKNIYKKIIIRDGRITGALFLTDIDRAGLYRHLVENQIDVTSFKEHLLDDDFGIGHLPLAEREAMFTVDQ